MAHLIRHALLAALCLIAGLLAPLSVARAETVVLGEATLSLPQGWQITDRRRDAELGLSGPKGEILRIFWWLPDEPLLGYEDEISHETRNFPAGPALIIRSRIAGRSTVQVAFERENTDKERLLFLIESETAKIAGLEARLRPFLQGLRFNGDPEPATEAPAPVAAPPSPLTFDQILIGLNPGNGGDCAPVDLATLPSLKVMQGLALTPEAAAICAASGTTIVSVALPQDPRQGQAGQLGRAYMRVFLAQGRKPLILVDRAHGVSVALTMADGSSIAVVVAELPGPQDIGLIFAGQLEDTWLPHTGRDGNFDDWAHMADGMLSVDLQSPTGANTTGIRSAEPLVRLPQPGDTTTLHLRFDFDPITTNNAVFALVPPDQVGKPDWQAHEIWVGIEQKRNAAPELILAVQRDVQVRYPIKDRAVLQGLALELRPDGLLLLYNHSGRVLAEGRMSSTPVARDLHIQVSATSPDGKAPARLDLWDIFLTRTPFDPTANPDRLLADTAQEVTLFDGKSKGPHLDLHGPAGPSLTEKLVIDNGLRIIAQKNDGQTGLGIYSPEPVIWLDRFGPGAIARLRFTFDAARTDGFRLALAAPHSKYHMEPGFPRFVLDWRKMPDGTIKAARWLDRDIGRLEAAPTAMPEAVDLVLTPYGVQVVAEGFPPDVLPWDALQEGQGLRLFAMAQAEQATDPVAMDLKRITLLRIPGAEAPAIAPRPGIAPLPVKRHFPDPAARWEAFGLGGAPAAEAVRFQPDGGVVVNLVEGYELGRAGVLSAGPVAVLDERIATTPYRLTLRFDPAQTEGTQVILSTRRVADMWKGSEIAVSLVRDSAGRYEGSYVLTLTRDYYAYWIRRLSAEDMARWDGTMMLDLSPGTVSVTLPDVVTQRGTGGFGGVAKGTAFHMVAQSLSDQRYGQGRMALRSVDGQWLTPDRMTALERHSLLDPEAFDPDAYLETLVDDLLEDGR